MLLYDRFGGLTENVALVTNIIMLLGVVCSIGTTFTLPGIAGAVVTVEPGIYLPGWGGVRLEDDLHLAAAGPELLSDNQVELVELV